MKKNYIFGIIFVILIIVLIVFAIYPFFQEIKRNSHALFLEKKRIILINKEGENLKKISNLYKSFQENLDKIETSFVDSESPLELIKFLEENANSSQLKLEILAVAKKTEKEDPWPSWFVQFSATGLFNNFLKFLARLENSPFLIEILDLNVLKLGEEEVKPETIFLPEMKAILSLKVFTK